MPRRLLIVLISSLASLAARGVIAEETTGPQIGGRLSRFRSESTPDIPPARLLIYQRARRLADARIARLESYEAMGYMPTRPTIPYTTYASDLNPGLYYKPWVSFYRTPVGSW
jgi:hypothetical protein